MKITIHEKFVYQFRSSQLLVFKNNLNFHNFSFKDDPYYCGLRARVPNFAKEKIRRASKATEATEETYVSSNRNYSRLPREPVMKRRSIANLDRHQPTFSSLYQLNQINDPRSSLYQRLHHHSYNIPQSQPRQPSMWHARSYESGIGKFFGLNFKNFFDKLIYFVKTRSSLNHHITSMEDFQRHEILHHVATSQRTLGHLETRSSK